MSSQMISGRFYAFRTNQRDNWTIFDCETEETAEASPEVSFKELREAFSEAIEGGGVS